MIPARNCHQVIAKTRENQANQALTNASYLLTCLILPIRQRIIYREAIMPPNTFKDEVALWSLVDLNLQCAEFSIVDPKENYVEHSLPSQNDDSGITVDSDRYWDWDATIPQSQEEKGQYWNWKDVDDMNHHDGMSVARQREIAEKRRNAISLVEQSVAQYRRDRFFSGERREQMLVRASLARQQELRRMEAAKPNAFYWD